LRGLRSRVAQSQVLLHTKDSMNNSISGSLGLIATLTSIIAITAQPQAGFAQSISKSAGANIEISEVQASAVSSATLTPSPVADLVKVGEQPVQRTQSAKVEGAKVETVAKVHTHEQSGQQIATLYVRNIPVLTFTMPQAPAADETKIGTVKVESYARQKSKSVSSDAQAASDSVARSSGAADFQDPTARASAIAAKINQLHRDGVDANQIAVSWKEVKDGSGHLSGQYLISANSAELVTINTTTLSAESTQQLDKDALQVTNRLRRLLGDAAPVTQIQGIPKVMAAVFAPDAGSVISTTKGWASWYGPGFDGNYTASGEVFNQEAMTAAHPSLPMGTRIRVTNLDTGRAVVVRVNDRGPYAGDRILDLSAGAARVIGVMDAGVAPIRLDVLGR
jgi:rare lipoprotein A